jgi:hypothetical protein
MRLHVVLEGLVGAFGAKDVLLKHFKAALLKLIDLPKKH